MEIDVENKKVVFEQNCKVCIHGDICKFRAEAKKVNESNMMYGMFTYLEWNHLQDKFEDNNGCKHYKLKYPYGEVSLESDPKIIDRIIDKELHKFHELASRTVYSDRTEDKTITSATIKNSNDEWVEKTFKVDSIIESYVVENKCLKT